MKLATLILLPFITCAFNTFAQELDNPLKVNSVELGKLTQQTETVSSVDSFSGSDLLATVSQFPGRSYVLSAPMNVQRATYLVSAGEVVEAGQPILILIGPEVHHYHSQYETSARLLQQSRSLYENNKRLYEAKSLSESAFLEITQTYYKTKLEYDEYTHFFQYTEGFDESKDALTVTAPIGGLVLFSETPTIYMNDILTRILPKEEVRLRVNVPVKHAQSLISLKLNQCLIPINSIENQVSRYYKTAWSEELGEECGVNFGEKISVTPLYSARAFQINKASVFEWEKESYVFYNEGGAYYASKVKILASTENNYIVESSQLSEGSRVLVSSVSAAQGILMGLGN